MFTVIAGQTLQTLTVADVLVTFVALAVTVVEPEATPVTGTFTLVAFAGTFTDAGTVAAPVLVELRLTVNALVCAGDTVKLRFCGLPGAIDTVFGENASVWAGLCHRDRSRSLPIGILGLGVVACRQEEHPIAGKGVG